MHSRTEKPYPRIGRAVGYFQAAYSKLEKGTTKISQDKLNKTRSFRSQSRKTYLILTIEKFWIWSIMSKGNNSVKYKL